MISERIWSIMMERRARFDFTSSTDPDFTDIARLLTNGHDDSLEMWLWVDGGSGLTGTEDDWIGDPDLVGNALDAVRLAVHSLSIASEDGGTRLVVNATWEFWGHPVFVAFAPPTDPDGAYLVDRNHANVHVILAEETTPVLEWQGRNETMEGAGRSWSVNKTGLDNGAYTYQVWAHDAAGEVHVSEDRRLVVGVHIWRTESVAYGFRPSLAFDADGVAHICFDSDNGLGYGKRSAAGWELETVQGGSNAGRPCSLAVDSAGRPHLAYGDASNPDESFLRYAIKDGGSWKIEVVDLVGFSTSISLALRPETETPFIAYYQSADEDLRFASREGGSWTTEVVDSQEVNGLSPSLAVDSLGRPRIAYFNDSEVAGNLSVRYAAWDGSAWQIEPVEATRTRDVDQGVAIALGGGDEPHLAYVHSEGIHYAVRGESAWQVESIEAREASRVDILLDAAGRPHITYDVPVDFWPNRDVRYMVKNSSWTVQVVSHNSSGFGSSIARSRHGHWAIAFGDLMSLGLLQYARRIAPTASGTFEGTLGLNGWYISHVTVELKDSDDSSGGAAIFFRINVGAWQRYEGPFLLADGHHDLEFYADNAVGLEGPTVTRSFAIDSVAPTVSLSVAADPVTSSTVEIALRGSDETSGVARYENSIDGGPFTEMGIVSSFAYAYADGMHTVLVRAYDAAGNVEEATIRFRVDTNLFSFSGPFRGLPTVGVLATATVLAVLAFRRFRPRKPTIWTR